MTDLDTSPQVLADLDGGPHDIEFFFDPGCPFAWQTSVWIRRVVDRRDIKVGWRFISLKFINEANDVPARMREAQEHGLRFHRVCAAARDRFGNDAVGRLYQAWGERYWYEDGTGDLVERLAEGAERIVVAEVVAAAALPADLLDAADDESWDPLIRAESDEAFRRTGEGVGTPIITYDPPNGSSLFGPVISSVPDDETALRLYDALRTFTDFEGFSELKRSKRPQLDLPLFAE